MDEYAGLIQSCTLGIAETLVNTGFSAHADQLINYSIDKGHISRYDAHNYTNKGDNRCMIPDSKIISRDIKNMITWNQIKNVRESIAKNSDYTVMPTDMAKLSRITDPLRKKAKRLNDPLINHLIKKGDKAHANGDWYEEGLNHANAMDRLRNKGIFIKDDENNKAYLWNCMMKHHDCFTNTKLEPKYPETFREFLDLPIGVIEYCNSDKYLKEQFGKYYNRLTTEPKYAHIAKVFNENIQKFDQRLSDVYKSQREQKRLSSSSTTKRTSSNTQIKNESINTTISQSRMHGNVTTSIPSHRQSHSRIHGIIKSPLNASSYTSMHGNITTPINASSYSSMHGDLTNLINNSNYTRTYRNVTKTDPDYINSRSQVKQVNTPEYKCFRSTTK